MIDLEGTPSEQLPPLALPIFRLLATHNIKLPSFAVIIGDNEIWHIKNIFVSNSYNFWGFTLDAYIQMRKLQNFEHDKFRFNKNKTAPDNDRGWSSKCILGTKLNQTKRVRAVNMNRLDVSNPLTASLVKMNKLIVGQFCDKYGNKIYNNNDFFVFTGIPQSANV